MRVWVTRAEPEAQRTAQALSDAGHDPLIAPLLEIALLGGAGEALDQAVRRAAALAFTSTAAVRLYARLRPTGERDWPVFAVGAATARAALDAGFADVASAQGDVTDLAALIAARAPTGPVLHPRALEPAGDLTADLTRRGVQALSEPIYETAPRMPDAAFLACLGADSPGVDAVMIHSAKAAHALASLLQAHPALAPRLILSAISDQAALPLASFAFARRIIAAEPNEPSMLHGLSQ